MEKGKMTEEQREDENSVGMLYTKEITMFEKHAEEYAEETFAEEVRPTARNAFKDGAEFGYNKANEWHYVKDGDLPKKELEEKQLLVRVRNYTEDYIFAYYMLDKYCSKNGKRFYSDIDCDYPIDTEDIIAWKEIVLPKESEECTH